MTSRLPKHGPFGYVGRFDSYAQALQSGWVGITTGCSTMSSGGKAHLFDRETGRTVCGRERGQMAVAWIPQGIYSLEQMRNRVGCCKACAGKATS